MTLKILGVASEMTPLAKTGALADVVGALPAALAAEGVETRTLIPGYPETLKQLRVGETVHAFDDFFGGPAWIHAARRGEIELYALVAPHLYARPGGLYVDEKGADYPDNPQRFAALAWAGAQIGLGLLPDYAPDVVHAHDWQAALAPVYLHYSGKPRPATILTIHNIAAQGRFPKELLETLRLAPESWGLEGVEHGDAIGFLKGGLRLCDRIATVSPRHAQEIETDEFGMGLGGLLRERTDVVSGILNGVDDAVWNPAKDARIDTRYDHFSLVTRTKNRIALQRRLQLRADPEAFLLGVVSPLTKQKGLDLLLDALPQLLARNVQLALLGAGDKALEEGFSALAKAHPGRVAAAIGYSEDVAHMIYAGVDAFVAPARVEPCGLTQLYALRYGAPPIVSHVGGLSDTVIDANEMALRAGIATGFQFAPPTCEGLLIALRQAERLFHDQPRWRQLQINGMKTDVSWRQPAKRYAELYRDVVAAHAR